MVEGLVQFNCSELMLNSLTASILSTISCAMFELQHKIDGCMNFMIKARWIRTELDWLVDAGYTGLCLPTVYGLLPSRPAMYCWQNLPAKSEYVSFVEPPGETASVLYLLCWTSWGDWICLVPPLLNLLGRLDLSCTSFAKLLGETASVLYLLCLTLWTRK